MITITDLLSMTLLYVGCFAGGAILGWGFAWHAKRTFQFEVTIVSNEPGVKEAELVQQPPAPDPPDINDADWWKQDR